MLCSEISNIVVFRLVDQLLHVEVDLLATDQCLESFIPLSSGLAWLLLCSLRCLLWSQISEETNWLLSNLNWLQLVDESLPSGLLLCLLGGS